MSDQATSIHVVDLGRMAYEQAWDEQRRVHAAVLGGRSPSTLLLVEHESVITITRRKGAADHLIASGQRLAELGVAVCPTNRGGDITYHGPGQMVAYPILRLNDYKLNLRSYVRLLERSLIDTLAEFGIEGRLDCSAPGVWVESATGRLAKIAAIGVRVQRWVSLHGIALNVDPDLEHFDLIVPCGLHGRPVTSIAHLLGAVCPTMDTVRDRFARCLQDRLGGG